MVTSLQVPGSPVCFSGQSSGADQCGAVDDFRRSDRQLCTTVRARPGDSGGPVYYPPDDGFTRAMGIVAVSRLLRGRMCYEPIDTVLDQLGVRLLTGP